MKNATLSVCTRLVSVALAAVLWAAPAQAATFDSSTGDIYLQSLVIDGTDWFRDVTLRITAAGKLQVRDFTPDPQSAAPASCADVALSHYQAITPGMRVSDVEALLGCAPDVVAGSFETMAGTPASLYTWRDAEGDTLQISLGGGVLADGAKLFRTMLQDGTCEALAQADADGITPAMGVNAIKSMLGCGPYQLERGHNFGTDVTTLRYRWRDQRGMSIQVDFNTVGMQQAVNFSDESQSAPATYNTATESLEIPYLIMDRTRLFSRLKLRVSPNGRVILQQFEQEGKTQQARVCPPFDETTLTNAPIGSGLGALNGFLGCAPSGQTRGRNPSGPTGHMRTWVDEDGNELTARLGAGNSVDRLELMLRNQATDGENPCNPLSIADASGITSGMRRQDVEAHLGCTWTWVYRHRDQSGSDGPQYAWTDTAGGTVDVLFDVASGLATDISYDIPQ